MRRFRINNASDGLKLSVSLNLAVWMAISVKIMRGLKEVLCSMNFSVVFAKNRQYPHLGDIANLQHGVTILRKFLVNHEAIR